MIEALSLALALLAGAFLGGLFFGGLWWTVQKAVLSKYAALWFFGSQLLRTSIALAGFYFIGHDHWERLLVCLLGFVIARLIVIRFTCTAAYAPKEASHAPYSR